MTSDCATLKGSVAVLWIRIRRTHLCLGFTIRHYFVRIQIRILPSTSKKKYEKPWFIVSCDFFGLFIYENWCKCTFKKYSAKKLTVEENLFLLASCQPMTKTAGSGPVSLSQFLSEIETFALILQRNSEYLWIKTAISNSQNKKTFISTQKSQKSIIVSNFCEVTKRIFGHTLGICD